MDEDGEIDPIDDFEADLHEAIDGLVKKYGDMMAVKWTTIIEYLDEDAEKGIWLANAPGASPWDVLGLLRYSLVRQEANAAAIPRVGD